MSKKGYEMPLRDVKRNMTDVKLTDQNTRPDGNGKIQATCSYCDDYLYLTASGTVLCKWGCYAGVGAYYRLLQHNKGRNDQAG